MTNKDELDGYVLGVLQAGPAHGYELVKRVRELSDGVLSVGEAKLYPCLHRLEAEGWVSAEWHPQEGKPARKVYTITNKGATVLAGKREAWERRAKGIASVLGIKRNGRG